MKLPKDAYSSIKSNAAIKRWMRSFLANSAVDSTYRKLLYKCPGLQDTLGYLLYLYRKNAIRSSLKPFIDIENNIPTKTFTGQRQLLVDISSLVLRDARTGVQRVTRSILQELLHNPPVGHVVEPIYVDAVGQLRYARKYAGKILGTNVYKIPEPLISVHVGDIFYSPDLYFPYPFALLHLLKRQGLRVVFTVHDLIPLRYADRFLKFSSLAFNDWISGVISVADGIVCVSRAVADELHSWVQAHPELNRGPLPIGFFHLGADIENSRPTYASVDEGKDALAICHRRPTFLMVGSILPHKGHKQVLLAVELLWKHGVDLNLIIIGKEGWRTKALTHQLRRHPERNRRMFWMENASDGLLLQLYSNASCLIAASIAEGFGLPLIESARQGLRIIARDIPVFREVAGEHAFYFQGETPEALAEAIRQWLSLYLTGQAPPSDHLPWSTWRQSTEQLVNVLLNNRWYIN